MQAQYPAQFVRDMGCTENEWLTWLKAALPNYPWLEANGQAQVPLAVDPATGETRQADAGGGLTEQARLHLSWEVLPPRQIALMRIPRLQVAFRFEGLSDDDRTRFMRRLDLLTQRGGG